VEAARVWDVVRVGAEKIEMEGLEVVEDESGSG